MASKIEITMVSPITLDQVEAAKDLAATRSLAKKFEPPVCLKKCDIQKQKIRLKLAIKKCEGKMKNVDALGTMMHERKLIDQKQRHDLLSLYNTFRAMLLTFDEQMRKHIEKKGDTEPDHEIDKYCSSLKQVAHKLIVAGETSSGKSTLLNIFLNESNHGSTTKPLLPTKLLSCTATVCEMEYSSHCRASVITRGIENSIEFDDKDKYIFKASDRENLYDHDAVALKVPSFFLKSGIKLIDTPGITESTEMGSIIKDYVMNNDPFGFIFTIASNRAGGVLKRFTDLLGELAGPEYEDQFGKPKFDPHSCMFVANFWDEVKDHDKPATKENIFSTLSKLPCMKNIDISQQVFFLNADFAYASKNIGLITDDFSDFVDGLEKFVRTEQRRKIISAYRWLETSLQRTLHPIKSYIKRMQQSHKERTKRKEATVQVLENIEKRYRVQLKTSNAYLQDNIEQCSQQLLQFMKQPSTYNKVTAWCSRDLPKEQFGDDWVLMEIKLDEAIDNRVSEVLKQWEDDNNYISAAEGDLMTQYMQVNAKFGTEIEQIELGLRNDNKDMEFVITPVSPLPEEKKFAFPNSEEENVDDIDSGKREFKVRYGRNHGYDIMAGNPDVETVKESFSIGPMIRVLSTRKNKKKKPDPVPEVPNGVKEFLEDKVSYMTERAAKIFSSMCDKQYSKSVITEQFTKVQNYLNITAIEILKMLKTNRRLLDAIAGEKRNESEIHGVYIPIENQVSDLLDEVIRYEWENLVEPSYHVTDIEIDKFASLSLFASIHHGHLSSKFLVKHCKEGDRKKRFDVTLKKLYLRPSQQKQQEKYLRRLVKRNDIIARFLGTYNFKNELVLVLNGTLHAARNYFFNDREDFKKREGLQFLSELGTALHYLHLKKLVHMEVSLDSILVKKSSVSFKNTLLLSNLGESSYVKIQQEGNQKAVGGYIHLPPEVLHNRGPYNQTADMFGLGVIMIELWQQSDIFDRMKQTIPLQTWIGEDNQGQILLKQVKHTAKEKTVGDKLNDEWKSLVAKCLEKDPTKRIDMASWQNEWFNIFKKTLET